MHLPKVRLEGLARKDEMWYNKALDKKIFFRKFNILADGRFFVNIILISVFLSVQRLVMSLQKQFLILCNLNDFSHNKH